MTDRFISAEVIRECRLTDEEKQEMHRTAIKDIEEEVRQLQDQIRWWTCRLCEHESELLGYELGRCPCPHCSR